MSKKQDTLELLAELGYSELLEVETAVKALKKQFIPFRIKKVYKKCGRVGCRCFQEYNSEDFDSKDEYNELTQHGPYLYVSYREDGKTKTASLGREYSQDEIGNMGNGLPNWYDFVVSQDKFEKLSKDRQWECYERSLSDKEFEAHYGINPLDDNIGRPRKLRYDRRAFDVRYNESKQERAVKWSDWSKLGVGTFSGITILDDLVKRGYYFKDW